MRTGTNIAQTGGCNIQPCSQAEGAGGDSEVWEGAWWLLGGETDTVESLVAGQGGRLCGQQLQPLPRPLSSPVAGTVGGLVVVCGGTDGFTTYSDCYTSQPARPELGWQVSPALLLNTSHAATAVQGEKMFVFGGEREPRCEGRPELQILTSRGGGGGGGGLSWSLSPATDPPRPLGAHNCAVTIASLILVIGGWTDSRCEGRGDSMVNYLDQVYILNTSTATWSEGPRLNTRRRDHGCTVVSVAGRLVSLTQHLSPQ